MNPTLRSILCRVILSCLVPLSAMPASAAEFHNVISLQGYTGILNTPNAEVLRKGHTSFDFNNQTEPQWRDKVYEQENYLFSFGFLPRLELTARFTEAKGDPWESDWGTLHFYVRDLSANVKLQIPLPEKPYLPHVAVGLQDLGGGAKFLQTKYVVASKEVGPLRLSAGYGAGPDRLKGGFGGVEAQAFSWLYLLGEKSPEEWAGGIRLVSPPLPVIPVSFHGTAKIAEKGKMAIAVGFEIPLGINDKAAHSSELVALGQQPAKAAHSSELVALDQQPTANSQQLTKAAHSSKLIADSQQPAANNQQPTKAAHSSELLANSQQPTANSQPLTKPAPGHELADVLLRQGFQNLRIGTAGDLLVIEYENNRFNWNELDGLGIVLLSAARQAPESIRRIDVVVKKKNLKVFRVGASREELLRFIEDPSADLASSLTASFDTDGPHVSYSGGGRASSYLTSSLVVYPGLSTVVGSEISPFEYLLSVKPDLYLNLWKGAVGNLRWDIPVAWSHEYDNWGYFRASRTPARQERAMLFQSVRLLPSVTATLGAGLVLPHEHGTVNDIVAYSPNGNHRLRLRQTWSYNSAWDMDRQSFVGSYRYWFTPLDLSLEASYGKFWWQDKGFVLDLKRYFGDTAISFYYKNTRFPDRFSYGLGTHWEAVGIQLSFPLTPRRDMKPRVAQLRGSEEWIYAQETSLASSKGGRNYLPPLPIGINFQPPVTTDRVFYGRDRLTPAYVKEHVLRMRDAYLEYGQ